MIARDLSFRLACKHMRRMVRCNAYKILKRRDKQLEQDFTLVTVPIISDILVDEYESNGQINYFTFLENHVENYFVTIFLFRLATYLIDYHYNKLN